MKLAERALRLTPSDPRRIYDEAQKHTGIIDLTLGDPDLPPPENVREAGCRGAASLAALALGDSEVPVPEIVREVRPDPARAAQYAEKFNLWKKFSDQIRSFK